MTVTKQYETFKLTDNDIWVKNLIHDILNRTNKNLNKLMNDMLPRWDKTKEHRILHYAASTQHYIWSKGWDGRNGNKNCYDYYEGPSINLCSENMKKLDTSKIYKIEQEGHYLNGCQIVIKKQITKNVNDIFGCFGCEPDIRHDYILEIFIVAPHF